MEDLLPDSLVADLPDGKQIAFRPLRPDDAWMIERGFEELSDASRYRRFFSQIDHLTEKQLEYLTRIDYVNHFAWIAYLPGDIPRGVGVARWVRTADDPEVAEAAVTVIDSFHNLGIGSTLLMLASASAVERGVRFFRAWTLGENEPMLAMLKQLGAQPGRWESGVLEVLVPLPDGPESLEDYPAPLILKEVAAGRLQGRADPAAIARMTFIENMDEDVDPDSGGGAPDRI